MGKLFLLCFLLISVNAFGQESFNFLSFKVEERDSAITAPCHLLVKNKNDSFLIKDIESHKNIAIPIDSSTNFIFIKGPKKIEIFQAMQFCTIFSGVNCIVRFDKDTLCTLIDYQDGLMGITYTLADISKPRDFDKTYCSYVIFEPDWHAKRKVKFKNIKPKH